MDKLWSQMFADALRSLVARNGLASMQGNVRTAMEYAGAATKLSSERFAAGFEDRRDDWLQYFSAALSGLILRNGAQHSIGVNVATAESYADEALKTAIKGVVLMRHQDLLAVEGRGS